MYFEEENQFLVEKKLFNKLDCDEDHGAKWFSSSSTQVNASVPPEAFLISMMNIVLSHCRVI